MSASLATLSGPVCARCSSGWGSARVQVRHADVPAVRACSGAVAAPAPVPVVEAVVELVAAPVAPPAPAPRVVVEGSAWVLGNDRLRVKASRAGRLYCVRMVNELERGVQPVWDMASGAITKLRAGAGRPMAADEVAEFGRCCGFCVFCNRALDDTRSVNAGYGPICAGKFDLPWG